MGAKEIPSTGYIQRASTKQAQPKSIRTLDKHYGVKSRNLEFVSPNTEI